MSTHGEGDAPDDAIELHEFVSGKKAPKLSNTKYAVLGLGDSSYEFFCQTGKDFDERLGKLGAKALVERADLDVDYEAQAEAWISKLIEALKEDFTAAPPAAVAAQTGAAVQGAPAQTYSKKAPYTATLLDSQKITGRDSVKDIRHIEISLEGSGIQYQAGDALGVWFKNAPKLVDEFISVLSLDGDAEVTVGDAKNALARSVNPQVGINTELSYFCKSVPSGHRINVVSHVNGR